MTVLSKLEGDSVSKHLQSLTVEGGNDPLNQGFGGQRWSCFGERQVNR